MTTVGTAVLQGPVVRGCESLSLICSQAALLSSEPSRAARVRQRRGICGTAAHPGGHSSHSSHSSRPVYLGARPGQCTDEPLTQVSHVCILKRMNAPEILVPGGRMCSRNSPTFPRPHRVPGSDGRLRVLRECDEGWWLVAGTCCTRAGAERAGQAVSSHPRHGPVAGKLQGNHLQFSRTQTLRSNSVKICFNFTFKSVLRITVLISNTDVRVMNVLCCGVANILHCNNDRELLLGIE